MAHRSLQTFLTLLCFFKLVQSQSGAGTDVEYMNQHLHANQHDDIYLSYIAVGSQRQCSYQLSFDRVHFNINGTVIHSENYPQSKLVRSTIFTEIVFTFLHVSLRLKNVNPSDAGVYGCQFSCGTSILSQSTLLRVYHPPEPATCEWLDKPNVPLQAENSFHLSILQCTAKNGYPRAGIICYAVDNQTTHIQTPRLVTGRANITATFWLEKDIDISCCSLSRKYAKAMANCLDYTTKPAEKKQVQTPSLTSGVVQVDTTTRDNNVFNGLVTDHPIDSKCKTCKCSPNMTTYLYVSIGILGSVIVILILLLLKR